MLQTTRLQFLLDVGAIFTFLLLTPLRTGVNVAVSDCMSTCMHFYLRQGGYVFTCVCLSVYPLKGLLKNTDQIFMKFYAMVGHNPVTNLLYFE